MIAYLRVLAGGGWLSNCRFKGLGDGLAIADLRVAGGGSKTETNKGAKGEKLGGAKP